MNLRLLKRLDDWFYLLPALFFLTFVLIIPLVYIFALSFYKMPLGREAVFIGFANFARILKDALFYKSLKNTFLYAFPAVGVKAVIGLAVDRKSVV